MTSCRSTVLLRDPFFLPASPSVNSMLLACPPGLSRSHRAPCLAPTELSSPSCNDKGLVLVCTRFNSGTHLEMERHFLSRDFWYFLLLASVHPAGFIIFLDVMLELSAILRSRVKWEFCRQRRDFCALDAVTLFQQVRSIYHIVVRLTLSSALDKHLPQ